MEAELQSKSKADNPTHVGFVRVGITILVVTVAFGYVTAVVMGKVPDKQRLGGTDLGVVVVSSLVALFLLRPEFLNRFTSFKFAGVEVELQKLQQDQQTQRNELDDVRFVLTLLLQEGERAHLRNLESGKTQNYTGNHNLRTELRKLRTLGLIQNCEGRKISELADKSKIDLKEIVQLTKRGKHYLDQLGEYSESTLS